MIFKKYPFILLFFFGTASAQYITTDESRTPIQLIENVLINSGCASVSNVSVSGGNFASGEKSWGYFNANGSSFPFSEGVVLSTGKIINTQGPNTFISDDGGGMGWTGDNDLNQALGLNNTFNATVLEFDFIPLGNQISFDYIFSSEQYLTNPNPNQCSFTDGFVFLLKEVGSANYENLAVIPNTNIPVRVNTVRGSGTICPAENEQYFGGFNGIEHPTNFNGQTTILTARATVIPGNQYHIKLVIADEGNYRYDSAIFLKGSSFSVGVDLGNDRTFANQNPVCHNENLTLNGTSNGAQSYQWRFNGNPIIGQTASTLSFSPPYNSSQNGMYSLATTYSPTCTNISEIYLEFAPELTIAQTSYSFCDNDSNQNGITTILLNDIVPTLFSNLPSTYQVGFYSSTTSTTLLPNSYQNTTPNQQIIYARILNVNCYNPIPVTLNILTFSGNIADETLSICVNVPVTLVANSGYQNYVWNIGATTSTIQVSVPGTYTVTFENASGCSITKTFTVFGSEAATIDNIIINDFSANNSVEIIASGIGDYEYSIDGTQYQDSPVFTNLNGLQYTAFVKDKKYCGIVSRVFYLVQIPKYFTPNGDGVNETWYIKNLTQRGLGQSVITIFDRYGKIITQFSGTDFGWDGTYNGRLLLADDYWFTITNSGKELAKGHFALIR
ncbi:choice-of-anchor L domain-containing protein [Flavobacterium sp.]|uniref:choice-of-anchor L domain-containing protein n=1 Tax=Flavobacterium sp. TaxID=239 RepID=UPI00391D6F9E